MKERKTELSLLNVFFCILVIFIHVSSGPVTYLTKGSLQLAAVFAPWKLSSFVVYGFLFLGGIRFSLRPPEDGIKGTLIYYRKRLTRVVIPYVLWVLVYCLWNWYALGSELSFGNYLYCLYTGRAASHFYYIVIATQFYALAPVWKRIKRESAPVVLPISLAVTMLFTRYLPDIMQRIGYTGEVLNDRIFTTYLFYWLAGIYAGLYYKEFCEFVRKRKIAVSVFYFMIAIPEVYCTYRGHAYGDWFTFVNELHVIYICAAFLFFFMIALMLKDLRFARSRAFLRIDRCTFSIYLAHLLVMCEWDRIQKLYIPSLSVGKAYPIRAIVTYSVTIASCVLVSILTDMIKKKRGKKI